ncbi:Gfo/Idh/MocA family oxidoreductase [Jeotgalibacillus sp. S-D1]|uniref:Gfo/Idh/MocA family protein n=1 Tax=Jeotgalibacillus sp. S-D1 TaxID=2552189 RepID=UPI001059606F|nr:Gfo/Idh/MocA family oxidoreductase [Jeotgalibacillus sp. S-D1]TDL30588.1 Gfo/Idh/MocA family oxidoreductase [Jeotgalibacillus sp. S-D1]
MLKIGIIGCGYISQKHLDTLLRINRVELAAVSDVQKSKMETAANYYRKAKGHIGSIEYYEDYLDLIQDEEIDIVLIAVISGLHGNIAKQALLAGKHVIVEKPLALSIEEADDIISLSKAKQKKVLVCHQLRYRPVMAKIKQVLKEGHLGDPYLGVASARINRSPEYYAQATWRGSWEHDGGMLINQGIHIVDLLIWLLGDMETVYGEIGAGSLHQKETEDFAAGIINFSNHAKGVIEVNSVTKPSNQGYSLSLFCEKGSLTISGNGLDRLDHCFIENGDLLVEELKTLSSKKNEHFYMYQNFIDCIENDQSDLVMDASEGKRALEAIFAIYQSNNLKNPITMPVTSFSTKEMKQVSVGRKKT